MSRPPPDPSRFARDLVRATFPETSPRSLARLARHARFEVLRVVAANARTPATTLFKLGARFPEVLRDHPTFVRTLTDDRLWRRVPDATLRSLLRLGTLPRALLERMATRRARDVREAAAARLRRMAARQGDEDGRRRLPLARTTVAALHEDPNAEDDVVLEALRQSFTIAKERVRCIEASALRKLRHPSRSKRLREFIES